MAALAPLGTKRLAMAVQKANGSFEQWTYETSGPLGPTDVDIEVTHNGLCHSDLHMQNDDWGISAFPLVPGHEVVGVVREVGSAVRGLRPGARVGVGWIRDSCRRCAACLRGEENICATGYTGLIVGAGNFGGFQKFMRAPADFTYAIPDGLDSAAAAPLLCAGVTVYAPLRKHIRKPDARVAVLGIGGLGHLGVQFASKMGAQVTAVDINASKEAEALKLGAASFVPFGDAFESCKGKFDVIINCVAANIDFRGVVGMLAPDGVAVQLGIPGGALIQLDLQDVVFGQKAMAGSIVGGRGDMQAMLQFAADKGVTPMLETMKLSQLNEAMDRLRQGLPRYRIVLETDL